MKKLRKRLSYANVMSSMAVFFVVGGGATAVATTHLGRNSVGTAQLKRGAVTAAKIRDRAITGSKIQDGSITGSDINTDTLPQVPVADSVSGEEPFGFYIKPEPSVRTGIATVGPLKFEATCDMSDFGDDVRIELATFGVSSSVGGATIDFALDNPSDTDPVGVHAFDELGRGTEIWAGEKPVEPGHSGETHQKTGKVLLTAPGGDAMLTVGVESLTVATNLPEHPGECFFAGTIKELSSGS